MNTGNWNIVKEVFNQALELPEDQRGSYLQKACGGNEELLKDVSGLLNSFDEGFMERPAIAEVAEFIVGDEDKLSAGDRLNHYRIVKLLGSGGMGEVYLAEDTKLNRQVAVKLLPPLSTTDPDANRRFLLEAQTAAELDHPHICTVHEIGESDGRSYIVMQYIKGETLAERIRRQPLTVKEALDFTSQIADALAEAHSRGIVHRDIKPSNVIIDPRGQARVLDFSLARKTFVDSEDITQVGMSMPGMIVGTVSYMSPEQARGKPLDVRTDIWSLGVVLYEMLTGKQPFKGETSSDTIAAILKNELPPLEQTGREFPVEISQIVRKALEKHPDKRYQSAHEMLRDLGRIPGVAEINAAYDADTIIDNISTRQQRYPFTGEEPFVDTASNTAQKEKPAIHAFPSFGFGKWVMAASLLLAIGIPGTVIWYRSAKAPAAPPANLVRTEITSWKNNLGMPFPGRARFSPDGKMIAFSSTRDGKQAIWLKQLNGGEPFTLKKEADDSVDTDPVFSPDGQQIAFISKRDSKYGIYTMPTFGGSATFISEIAPSDPRLLTWSKDGTKIFYSVGINVFTVDLNNKTQQQITDFNGPAQEVNDFAISPDEQRIAFLKENDGTSDIQVSSQPETTSLKISNDPDFDSAPLWHPNGEHIIYNSLRSGTTQIFKGFLDGRPPLQLTTDSTSTNISDISSDGSKVLYRSSRDESDIWQIDLETKKESPIVSELKAETWPNTSPDGQKMAFQSFHDSSKLRLDKSEITVVSLNGETRSLLTEEGYLPVWSPDGSRIAFFRDVNGEANIWVTANDSNSAKMITKGPVSSGNFSFLPLNSQEPQSLQWSKDNKSIVYVAIQNGLFNILETNADGSGEKQLSDNTDEGWEFFSPILSPDGTKVAWTGVHDRQENHAKYEWAIFLLENGQTKKIYSSKSYLGLVGWSKSENELIFKNEANGTGRLPKQLVDVNIYRLNVNSGANKPGLLATLKECQIRSLRLSPDKTEIAFVDRLESTDTLKTLPLTGGDSQQILRSSDPQVYFSALAWAPDGKSIFFGKHANWSIISMLENLN